MAEILFSKHTTKILRRQPALTMLLLSIMGEGRGVPDIGVEIGVLISSIIFMIFSGTLVASPHVSCHLGSLELINSADYKFKRNKTKDKCVLLEGLTQITNTTNVFLAYHWKYGSYEFNSVKSLSTYGDLLCLIC